MCVYISHVGLIIEAHRDTYGIRCFFTIGSHELFYFEGKMFKPEVILKITSSFGSKNVSQITGVEMLIIKIILNLFKS